MPGLADAAAIQAMQQRARERRAFLIVDCGEADTVATVTGSLTGKIGADAPNSAFYFPWVVAPDPLQQNAPRAFPPCGFVAGIFARVDASRGVWKAPAGIEALLAGATGLAVDVNDAENGLLNPRAINCLRSFPAVGHVVWGARTLDGDDSRGSEWKYVPVRRFALFLEQSIYSGTQWAVFEPNDEPLWAKIRRSVAVFMTAVQARCVPGRDRRSGLVRQMRPRDDHAGRYRRRGRQYRGRLRAAQAGGVCHPHDRADGRAAA